MKIEKNTFMQPASTVSSEAASSMHAGRMGKSHLGTSLSPLSKVGLAALAALAFIPAASAFFSRNCRWECPTAEVSCRDTLFGEQCSAVDYRCYDVFREYCNGWSCFGQWEKECDPVWVDCEKICYFP